MPVLIPHFLYGNLIYTAPKFIRLFFLWSLFQGKTMKTITFYTTTTAYKISLRTAAVAENQKLVYIKQIIRKMQKSCAVDRRWLGSKPKNMY